MAQGQTDVRWLEIAIVKPRKSVSSGRLARKERGGCKKVVHSQLNERIVGAGRVGPGSKMVTAQNGQPDFPDVLLRLPAAPRTPKCIRVNKNT